MEIFEKSETYFSEEHPFKTKNQELRNIFLTTSLEKTFKWSLPTYTLNHKNVLALGKFKNHYEIWFFNGVFLSDPNKVLLNAQEEKTKAMQQWRFTVKDTINLDILLAYSEEAIANKKKVKTCLYKKALLYFKNSRITNRCVKKNKTQQVLHTLPPYKQKEYMEYIASTKQEKTKTSRLEKIIPLIKKRHRIKR